MQKCSWPGTLFWSLLLLPPLGAADSVQIKRTPPAKEPAYQSKAPGYCLLVIGPEAKKRIWIVLDGDKLYVDRNGNGDLTEPGEQLPVPDGSGVVVAGKPANETEGIFFSIPLGALPASDPRPVFSNLIFAFTPSKGKKPVSFSICTDDPKIMHKQKPQPGFGTIVWVGIGSGILSKRPQDAPIIYLNGPLAMNLAAPKETVLVRGKTAGNLYVTVGTFVTDNGSRILTLEEIPAGVHPEAEIKFPAASGQKPIRVRFLLKERCCGNLLYGPVQVPEAAADGKAKVTLTFSSWKEGKIALATFHLPIVETAGQEKGQEKGTKDKGPANSFPASLQR
jgi:hypothetical protein